MSQISSVVLHLLSDFNKRKNQVEANDFEGQTSSCFSVPLLLVQSAMPKQPLLSKISLLPCVYCLLLGTTLLTSSSFRLMK